MTADRVALIRAINDAMNRGDLDAAVAPLHLDVVYGDVTRSRFRGRATVRKYLAEVLSSFETYREAIEEVASFGDVIAVGIRSTARAASSGVELDEAHGEVHVFAGDSIIEVTSYPTYGDALEAARLRARSATAPTPRR